MLRDPGNSRDRITWGSSQPHHITVLLSMSLLEDKKEGTRLSEEKTVKSRRLNTNQRTQHVLILLDIE